MKKILNIIALVLNSVIVVIALINLVVGLSVVKLTANETLQMPQKVIGIIGGADGPTSIYISGNIKGNSIINSVLLMILIFFEIVFIMNTKKQKKGKK